MRTIVLAVVVFAAAFAPRFAYAANEPGPPGPCVRNVVHAMSGTWGIDDATFQERQIPLSAWHILTQSDPNIMAVLTNGETNVWFLTEHGLDTTHDLRNGAYEGVTVATELLRCQELSADGPAILESRVLFGARATRLRERIELTADRLTIRRFDRNDRLVSEQLMRRHTIVAIDPPPMPPNQP